MKILKRTGVLYTHTHTHTVLQKVLSKGGYKCSFLEERWCRSLELAQDLLC